MKTAYWPRLRDDVLHEPLLVLAAEQPGDPGEPAEPGEPEQRREPEDAEARDRAEQVEPAAPVDEVVALRVRPPMFDAKSIRKTTQIGLS